MVHFKVYHDYFSKFMRVLNEQRKDGTICDISLIVGTQVVKAHRCVLAAGSSYFNVMFLGQFTEASMNEINLSEVTKDIGALEMMVNFLYTGEIDINAENLGTVVKLSSYFIMDTVLNFCNSFIIDTLSLQNCLKYYLFAVEHGLTDIEAETFPMVKTRLHDFTLFEEETLNISPKEIMYLHQNDVFQFCTPHDLLKFVVKWVRNGATEQHISVGTDILDFISCMKENVSLPLVMHSSEEDLHATCKAMISTITKAGLEGHEAFCHHFSKLSNQCFEKSDGTSENNHQVLPTANNMSPTTEDADKEDVLITLSPKKSIVDYYFNCPSRDKARVQHLRKGEVFDMCAYVPSRRCWYYLKTIDDQVMAKLDSTWTMNADTETEDPPSKYLDFIMRCDQLVFLEETKIQKFNQDPVEMNSMIFHNLNSGTWEEFEYYEQIQQHLQDNEFWSHDEYAIVNGTDSTLYMITVIGCLDEGDPDNCFEVYFRCFKFEDIDHSWQIFFQTEKYKMEGNLLSIRHVVNAKISTASNEMLCTYCDQNKRIFCGVNLNSETPTPVLLLELDNTCESLHMDIVEGRDQLFFLQERRQDDQLFIKVRYEYKYHSNSITLVETDELELEKAEIISKGNDDDFPWEKNWQMSERESLWYISGNMRTLSALTEVTVNSNRAPVVKLHPPPPFTCLIAAFEGTVTEDVLKGLQPVSFLGRLK